MDKNGFGLQTSAWVFMLASAVASPAMAATITVTTDSEDDAGMVECTLWEAIENANTDSSVSGDMACPSGSGADEIVFADGAGYTLTVSGQLPAITSEVRISGRGAGTTIIQANADPDTATYRVFEVSAAGNLTLNDLTVQNGKCDGACSTVDNYGGGILNGGTLALNGVEVLNSRSSGGGGGIYSTGNLVLSDSRVAGNQSSIDGGGIHANTLTSVTTIIGSQITDNSGLNGGAVMNYGSLTVGDSTISGNSASGSGGGFFNWGMMITISGSTINGNTATVDGGAIANATYFSLSDSTITGNTAQGVSGGGGGAIYQFTEGGIPELYLNNVTLAGNNHETAGGDGIYLSAGVVFTTNSIISGNGTENCSGGPILSNGYNLEDSNSCNLTGSGDLVYTDPLLDSLADNGGSTLTMALLPDSPAINAGLDASCRDYDQRGVLRPQGSHCDIGSYELEIDTDGDGVLDNVDNCPDVANADQLNTDGDTPGDACDDDDDDDGIPDAYEDANGMDSKDPDDIHLDNDGDGFSNYEEYNAGSAANDASSSPGLLSLSAASYSVYEGDTFAVTITRSGGTTGVVTIDCGSWNDTATAGGTDYSDDEGTVEWADGEGGSKTCMLITTVDDGADDDGETFGVGIANPGGAHVGSPDTATVTIKEFIDDDGDTIGDDVDNCLALANSDQLDTDGDSLGNACDSDDDNDGVLDADDALPLDAGEWLDTDGDGIGNNADSDDDNDGYSDAVEIDEGSDTLSAADTPLDTDGDYEPNSTDSDDDNDGVLDADDAFPLDASESIDTDGDGIGNNADTDDDNDGVADTDDAFPLDASESMDSDGDGIGDNQDPVDDRLAATSSSGGAGGAFDPLLLLLMGAGIGWWRRRES